ncbi:hypothetical protein U5922_009480 [Aquicoccus sp. G2-2]|uniref:hypothetical protein n=1 Tax=Aquicoccus sp. G2-2 TaxID=3092120 RepID=UPI002ADF67DE|nr:hypothetical protein [Aquicoccus sp. G2-2]MEA1113698.1 hypothetical protein [Aquicoccus sp. G2-2]
MTAPRATKPTLHIVTPLHSDEQLLGSWRPQFLLFMQRSLILSFITALALASLGYLTPIQWLIAVPVFTVGFLVIFDDFSTWFDTRRHHWYLTNHRLIFEVDDEPENNAALPLGDINWMRPWFWWGLRIGFSSGTAMDMRFIKRPRDLRARILAAQTNANESPAP